MVDKAYPFRACPTEWSATRARTAAVETAATRIHQNHPFGGGAALLLALLWERGKREDTGQARSRLAPQLEDVVIEAQ